MPKYDPKSMKAEEFINDEEIRETLAYAEANKNNVELIDQILEKARPVKTEKGCVCAGLTHREASVLLACEIPEKIERMYEIAEEIRLANGPEVRVTVPGHVQRGGSPCPYDRVLSTRIGVTCADLILHDEYGYMVGIVNGKMKKVPLGEVAGKLKTISPKDQIVQEAKLMGISFGD